MISRRKKYKMIAEPKNPGSPTKVKKQDLAAWPGPG
jgi:hypothetical protein